MIGLTIIIQVGNDLVLWIVGATVIILNILFYLKLNKLVIFVDNLVKKIIERIDGKIEENYSASDWLSSMPVTDLYTLLSEKKINDKNNIMNNFLDVKNIIKNKYNNEKKLEALKLALQCTVESPKLTMLTTGINTLFIPIIITFATLFINNTLKSNFQFSTYVVLLTVMVGYGLGVNYISRKAQFDKSLLKIVEICLEEVKL